MKLLILLALLSTCTYNFVVVKSPEALTYKIADSQGNRGYMDYSVSTFGYFDY
jgi:hypothetical protein